MIEPAIAYNASSQWILNVVLAFITLGIALDLKLSDFADIAREPKSVLVGLTAQFLLLPALTYLLVCFLQVDPGIALGMFLVACCPGGGMSNFFTHHAQGNVALSIAMTAFSASIAMFMLPINFLFWSSLNSDTAELLRAIEIDRVKFTVNLIVILAVPLSLGLWIRAKHESFAIKLLKPLRKFSVLALVVFIIVGLGSNISSLVAYISMVFGLVVLGNAMALALGFFSGKLAGLSKSDQKAISIEVGIQNSALGLAIIYGFFGGNGYMAIVAAFWGIWHLIAGFTLAHIYRKYYN